MTLWTFEGAVMPDREAPVRECPICPPWVECAHYGDLVIRLVTRETMKHWPNRCYVGEADKMSHNVPLVNGPGVLDREAGIPACKCWSGYEGAIIPNSRRSYRTEAEARAEFDRRVAIMLGRNDDDA